jgi:APA family basic amino acid/polyamine antiporter
MTVSHIPSAQYVGAILTRNQKHMAHDAATSIVADTGLVRVIGVRGLAANTVNNIVGSGIFVLPAVVAAMLGPAAIIAYVICAIAAGLIALVFAEAGSRVSAPGGTYAYIETAFGPFVGFLAGVLFWFGSQMISSAAIAMVFVGSLGALMPLLATPLPRAALLLLLYIVLAGLNIRGVRTGVHVVEIFTVAKLLPLIALVVVGAFFIHPANLVWTAIPSFAQIGTASLLLVFAFQGTEGALTSSGEVRDPSRTVPRAILLALLLVSALYVAIQLVAQGVLGPALASDQAAPLVAVAQRTFGSTGAALLAVAAAVSAFGFVSGDMLATPRILFAFGRDGFLPRKFGTVHKRYHSPTVAIVAHAAACCAFAITGTFRSLVILSTVSALLIYLGCCFSTIELRRRNVLADGPPFTLRGGPTIPLLASVVVIWMLTSASRVEYISVAIVLAVATVLYFIRPRRSGSSTETVTAE